MLVTWPNTKLVVSFMVDFQGCWLWRQKSGLFSIRTENPPAQLSFTQAPYSKPALQKNRYYYPSGDEDEG